MKQTISRKKVLAIVSVIALLLLIATFSYEEEIALDEVNETKSLPLISYQAITPQSYPVVVKAFGVVTPLWQTTLRAQVDGQVDFISPALQPGNRVTKGQPLLTIDPRPYVAEVAEAKSRHAHAITAYLKEKHEAKEAQKNWKRAGFANKPDSKLVFRQPQLDATLADVESTKAVLTYAEKKLSDTNITAPYNGVVVSRTINKKENLFVGDTIATIYADESAEIPIKLDFTQWQKLPQNIADAKVTLKEPRLHTKWQANIKRLGQTIEPQTGLLTLYLEVNAPFTLDPPLLPGTFVEAHIEGKIYTDILKLPETALTKQGNIWVIDEHNLLKSFQVKVLFYNENEVYVHTPLNTPKVRVALKPNHSFLSSQRVEPVEER
jgi:RND family efflux transporter MFP subunit